MEVSEIFGSVRSYDALKGYGFIAADEGDVLLHVTALRAVGFDGIKAGARVRCLATKRPRGLQVFRVLSIDGLTIARRMRSGRSQAWQRARITRVTEWGAVWMTRGPRFPDIYAQADTMRRLGLAGCQAGDTVQIVKQLAMWTPDRRPKVTPLWGERAGC
jgi:CspA family cold shock protein